MRTQKTTESTAPRTRRDRALQTRRRMLVSAYELFSARGYAATTMDAIATRADVAVQTLYFTFHSKGAILSEAFGAAILGFDRWDPRAESAMKEPSRSSLAELHAWWPRFEAEPDPVRALRIFVDAAVEILARVGPLAAIVRAAAASDLEVRAAERISERRRADAYAIAIDILADKGPLRAGVRPRRAADILLTLLGAETYRQLTTERGWSAAECRRFLLDVLTQQLLDPA